MKFTFFFVYIYKLLIYYFSQEILKEKFNFRRIFLSKCSDRIRNRFFKITDETIAPGSRKKPDPNVKYHRIRPSKHHPNLTSLNSPFFFEYIFKLLIAYYYFGQEIWKERFYFRWIFYRNVQTGSGIEFFKLRLRP